MNKTLTTLLLAGGTLVTYGQSLAPEVIASAGEHFDNGNAQLEWTLGEVTIETYSQSNDQLTQGFHQTRLLITSLNEHALMGDISVFPNPTTGQLNIVFPASNKDFSIHVFDASGRLLITKQISNANAIINLSNYANGTYFLHVNTTDAGAMKAFKILKTL